MALPKPTVYKDVNSDMKLSSVTTEKAREYLGRYNVEFDQKVVDLYEEKFLLYLRAYTTDTMDFFRSACRAEMRKKITYTVDVSILKHGYIHEAQSECGAGEGPFGHCKHIRTVLYACCKFLKCGECKMEVSCTEKLQSFDKAKKHTSSPLKARDLNVECADICDIKDCDPRPLKFRNQENYKDHFQNTCLNFKGISRTPIFQTFEPANMRAYAGDHDYFERTHEESFLRALHLSQISRKDVEKIELVTRGQSQNERWFEEREKRIQSSNFHRICTATNRTDMGTLATSFVHGQVFRQNEVMQHGVKYEREAIHRYEQSSHVNVKTCGIFVSKPLPFLGASPDGVVDENLIVEVKCPFSAKNKPINPVTVPYLKDLGGHISLSKKTPILLPNSGSALLF